MTQPSTHGRQFLLDLVAAVVLSASACLPFGFGDPLHEVDIENTTAVAVHVYQDGARRGLPLDVSAHATAHTAFAWPIDSSDGRGRMILAEDATGRRVYCETFRYADLVKVDWKIRVVVSDLCG